MSGSLQGLNCVITGGTGNMGREVVKEFVHRGARVMVNYRAKERFDRLQEFTGAPPNLAGFQADLSTEKGVDGFFREINDRVSRLDVVLHLMGGFWMGGDLADTPYEKWEDMFRMNLHSSFLVGRAAFRRMKETGGGKLFFVGAKAGLELPAGLGAYSISKAALLAFTKVLAKEGTPHNIAVNAILPSIIDTPANRAGMPDADYSAWISPVKMAVVLADLSDPRVTGLSETFLKMYGKS